MDGRTSEIFLFDGLPAQLFACSRILSSDKHHSAHVEAGRILVPLIWSDLGLKLIATKLGIRVWMARQSFFLRLGESGNAVSIELVPIEQF